MNDSTNISSNFFTNRNNNTLIKEFEGILQHNNNIRNLDAVVGFLRRIFLNQRLCGVILILQQVMQ